KAFFDRFCGGSEATIDGTFWQIAVFVVALFAGGLSAPALGQNAQNKPTTQRTGEQPDGSIVVPSSSQVVTPVGKVDRLDGARPKDVAISPDGQTVAVLTTSGIMLYAPDGSRKASFTFDTGPLGLAWAADSKTIYATGGHSQVHRVRLDGGKWKLDGSFPAVDPAKVPKSAGDPEDISAVSGKPDRRRRGNVQATGLALSADGKRLYVALGISNAVSVLDLEHGNATVAVISTGIAPYRTALSPDGKTLYVANRGGRAPTDDEPSETSAGTAVRIDPKTDAALRGSLSIIDTETFKPVEVDAGRQPSDLVCSSDGKTVYVVNSDEDTLTFFDGAKRQAARTISLRPPLDPGFGQIPARITLTSDGNTAYVACGGGNAVAVVDLPKAQVTGYIPTAWYPIAVAERDGKLFVADSKGFGARLKNTKGAFRSGGSVGAMQFIEADQLRDLPALTKQVAVNNRWGVEELPPRKDVAPVPVPERVGEPSVFKHVVFIIKENHTYDGMLGDMKEGNGDPSLCMFGENVTPNHHALSRQFVLLDNTYTSGTNSADGHQWTVSGVANGYIEQNYAAHVRSYPFNGGDPLAYSPEGFLWSAAVKAGKSLRVYGEFVNKPRVRFKGTDKRPKWTEFYNDYKAGKVDEKYDVTSDTDNPALKPYLHPKYVGFPTVVTDQWKADVFLDDVKKFEQAGDLPALCIVHLPNDHTTGMSAGYPTPRAQVADNDLALGRIVEGISKSKFWKESLILVIEDDSAIGLDHVDGHRTVAFCISPYTRRGAVVSENYNHPSLLRTMELVLGLPAMNRFDRTATRMTACFVAKPNFEPYTHVANKVPLDEMNPPAEALNGEAKRLAEACDKLDWSQVDRANFETVARAAWISTRPGEAFPIAKFHPYEDMDDDDGDRDHKPGR
ncbi:MAG TPA: alkaline phosphatase family protein, partial [Gemmataceae bacterium]|nr:alkaline phosphatase family protein [Gemmataceae bacterium]